MKRFLVALSLVMAMCFSIVPNAAFAASAYQTPFSVSITYQNVGNALATVNVSFFAENSGTAQNFSAGTLAAGASTSLSVGKAISSGSFKGSAVLSSDQPVIATIVQLDSTGTVKNRPLSNGFGAADGASKQLIATVLKNKFSSSTIFSVQNTESSPVNVTAQFFAVGSTSATATVNAPNLPAGAAKYFDVGSIAQLPSGFNGSAIVTAKLSSNNSTAGKVVVTVNELDTAGGIAKSFEGSSVSGAKVYMPSATCNAFGGQSTSYAVQNADLSNSVSFQVRYKRTNAADLIDGPYSLAAGGKKSIITCNKMPGGTSGSAIIERTSGAGSLVAVGKVSGNNFQTAFLGIVEGIGSAKIAVPYVRWASDANVNADQRSALAIQNIGSAPATNVTVKYIDRNGAVKGTQFLGTLAVGAKGNSSPKLASALDGCGRFGIYGDGCASLQFGGGAIVTADSGAQLAVVVRVISGSTDQAGEDYNGINVQ